MTPTSLASTSTTSPTCSIPYREKRQDSPSHSSQTPFQASSYNSFSENRQSQSLSSQLVEAAARTDVDDSDYDPKKTDDQDKSDSEYNQTPPKIRSDIQCCFRCRAKHQKCDRIQPRCGSCRTHNVKCKYPSDLISYLQVQRTRAHLPLEEGYRKPDQPDSGAEISGDRASKRRRITTEEGQTEKGSHSTLPTTLAAQWVNLDSKSTRINVSHDIHDSSASHHNIRQSQPRPSESQDKASSGTVTVNYRPGPTVQHNPGQTSKSNAQALPVMTNLDTTNNNAPRPSLNSPGTPEASTKDCMLIFRGPNIERTCPLSHCQTVNEFLMNATLAGIYQGSGSHLQCVLSSGTTKYIMSNAYNREQDFQMLKATIEEEKSESALVTEWRLT